MWHRAAAGLVVGYLTMSRSFAYLGVPALNLYIGEAVLGAFALKCWRAVFGRWFCSLFAAGPLFWTAWSLLLFAGWGLAGFVRGLYAGHSTLICLQNLAFNAYPLYFFVGLWVCLRDRSCLQRTVRCLAWANGLYGVMYILFLNQLPLTIPGSPGIGVFGQPAGSAVALAGLLTLERNLIKHWLPLLLNGLVLLGLQVRAEWLGLLTGLLVWAVLTVRPWKLAAGSLLIGGLLAAGYLADVSVPSPAGRTGDISVNEIVGRVIAPFDLETASGYSDNAHIYAGTFQWRTKWWDAIWYSVHEDSTLALAGHGYGYPLTGLVSYLRGAQVRTPHSVFFYALGYGGWIGVVSFLLLQLSLAALLWRAYRLSGQPFGVIFQVMSIMAAHFSNFFETPFGAIPFYLLAGMTAARALDRRGTSHANTGWTLPVPAPGR